jgi:F420-non-reducing hydrogenase iron-sulfur subunit
VEAKVEVAQPKVLVLATVQCAYPGADAVGQSHTDYPANVYIMQVPDTVMFPVDFYLRCFEKGIGGIIIMSCGTESPYEGSFERTAARIRDLYNRMTERGIDPKRVRLTSICTVCIKSFLKEVNDMNNLLKVLGPVKPAGKTRES